MKEFGKWETSVMFDGTEWEVCEEGGGDAIAAVVGEGQLGQDRAWRIVECVNALEGIEDPAGYLKMMRAHVAAQHESLGKCADKIVDLHMALAEVSDILKEIYDEADHMLGTECIVAVARSNALTIRGRAAEALLACLDHTTKLLRNET